MSIISSNKLKVFLRIRGGENAKSYENFRVNTASNTMELENKTVYSFSRIFQNCEQGDLFETVVCPLLRDVFVNRKPGLCFSYGITNSGKTFTVIGTDEKQGLLPLTIARVLQIRAFYRENREFPSDWGFAREDLRDLTINNEEFKLDDIRYEFQSFEIYNEELVDLTQDPPRDQKGQILARPRLALKENNRKIIIKDLKSVDIPDYTSFEATLSRVLSNRSLNETILNSFSSRSHCLFKLTLTLLYKSQTSLKEFTIPLLLVDLAGSERAKRIDNYGQSPLMTEACNINKSLLVLGRCLKALSQNSQQPSKLEVSPLKSPMLIPYRDSKLTRILFEYFNESSNINMIVNLNSSPSDFEENLRVLDYANVAKQIQPARSVLGLKTPLVSEKTEKFREECNTLLNEKILEQQKKIEMLEGIVSSLNDQLIVSNVLARLDNILEGFERENQRILTSEIEDLRRLSEEAEIYTVKVFPKNGNQESCTSFRSFGGDSLTRDKNGSLTYSERNPKEERRRKEYREVGLNTSPWMDIKNPSLEIGTSPLNIRSCLKTCPSNLKVTPQKKGPSQDSLRQDQAKSDPEPDILVLKVENIEEADKENQSLMANIPKKKAKRCRKPKGKKKKTFEGEPIVNNDLNIDMQINNYKYMKVNKEEENPRMTPMEKRLRARPKKHNCEWKSTYDFE